MLKKIKFKNYKLFKDVQELELKPITIVIGKNSSGKSAVLKLFTLIEDSLSKSFPEPLHTTSSNGIELGGEFSDLIYGRERLGKLDITLESGEEQLEIVIASGTRPSDMPEILYWQLNGAEADVEKETFKGFLSQSHKSETLTLKTDYITSTRTGLKPYFEKSLKIENSVGLEGENVYSMLIEDALTTPKELLKKVSTFYKANFEDWGVRVNQDKAPVYAIELENNRMKINIRDVGLGMIHALPLVVRALMPTREETLIIMEEPELHLHPAAHGNLAQLFAESIYTQTKDVEANRVLNLNRRYLIETHSQNFILRLRRLIAEGKLDKENVVIYYVDYKEDSQQSNLKRINIDKSGRTIDESGGIYWPQNIFSQTLDETSAIRTAQLKQQNNGH